MNSVFSVDDMSDPIWATAAESLAAAAEGGLGMTRSQSEWAFQRLLEEMAAAGSPISASSATGNPIGRSSPPQSQPSVSRPEEVDGEHVIEIQKPQNHDCSPNHLHRTEGLGNRNSATPSDPSPTLPIDSDQYRAILKNKLDLACAAAVALRGANVKPEYSGASADHQKQPAKSGSQARGSPMVQTSPVASSASVPTVPATQRKADVLARQAASGSSRDDSDDEEFEGDTETTENLDLTDIKRARRMLSNRESARRSRRRKQEQMNELETQAGQLRVEHSSLLKRLSDINHKYDTAAVDNRILKADIETLRTKVKMAEDTVKRMTGMNPLLMARSTMPNAGMQFESSPTTSSRISAPSPNHVQRSAVSNITSSAPDQRVENNFSSSSTVPPTITPVRNASVENLIKMPLSQNVASTDHLEKQVIHGGSQNPVASGANSSEVMSGWNHEVAKNNPPQK